jgi:hypothetical protein
MSSDQYHGVSNVIAIHDMLYVRMPNLRKSGWLR